MNNKSQIEGKFVKFVLTVIALMVLTNKLRIFRKVANCGWLQDLLVAKNPLLTNSTLGATCDFSRFLMPL